MFLTSMLEPLLIATALSIDAFYCGFVYGSKKIMIPLRSMMTISVISCLILALSLQLGAVLKFWVTAPITTATCFLFLLGLGMVKMFDGIIKVWIRAYAARKRKNDSSRFHLGLLLQIFASPEKAGHSHSGLLSAKEAICLSLALSLDELTAGFCLGITGTSPIFLLGFACLFDLLAIMLGFFLGHRLTQKRPFDLSLMSGALFLILAIMKLP